MPLKEPKKRTKNEPKQPKIIWLELHLVITCPLCNLASINQISLVSSTPNWNPFEVLDFWLLKLQNHMWFASKSSWEVAPILSWSQHHCASMLIVQPSFNRLQLPHFNSELRFILKFVSTMENLFNSDHTQIHHITTIYCSVSHL